MQSRHESDVLAKALLDLVGMMNSPRQDNILLAEAGVSLDRALFPLLVRIGVAGSLSIVELAEQAGRDHSTVSRQTAKLEHLGLVAKTPSKGDRRVREAFVTASGRRTIEAITLARRRVFAQILSEWTAKDRAALARLNRRFALDMAAARLAFERRTSQ